MKYLRFLLFVFLVCVSHFYALGASPDYYKTKNKKINKNEVHESSAQRRVCLDECKGKLTQKSFMDVNGNLLENTIFVVQHNFEIDKEIILPNNSVLEFEGGSILNGRIHGNNSEIKTNNDKILKNVILDGVWKNEKLYVEWFEVNNNAELVNMLVNLNTTGKKTILFQKNKFYSFTDPIVVFEKDGIIFDFNNCVIQDAISIYRQASYNAFIYVSKSSNIFIQNLDYTAIDKNTTLGIGGYNPVVIRLGDSVYKVYNIEINNLKLNRGNDSSNLSIIDIVGDTYNCTIDGIECSINASYGINCEFGKLDNSIKSPHNISIKNVVGRNMSNCLGFLRTSCAYNVCFENCYGYNVQRFIDIWSGDVGSCGSINNVTFLNCSCEYDDGSSSLNVVPVVIDNARRVITNSPESLIYPMAIVFNNCHILNKGAISEGYALAIKDTQAPISFFNCVIKGFKHAANIDYSRKSNKPIVYDGIDNNVTFNHCFIDGQFVISRTSVSLFDSYLKSNCQDDYLIKASDAARLYIGANTIDCNDRNSCIFVTKDASSGIIVNNRFTGLSKAYDLNIPCIVSNNMYNGSIGNVTYMVSKDDEINKSGPFKQKPKAANIYVGFHYFCTDRRAKESDGYGIEIIHKGDNVWVDALGRIIK